MDIGPLDQPVLIFGGPYNNLEATQALLKHAKTLGIPPERMICTGDVVAYCADPEATTDLIASSGINVVLGNCEESLSADSEDCGCGFAEGSICDALSVQWYAHARQNLTATSKRWMASLPRYIELEMTERRLTVVHGAPSAINRYIFESTEDSVVTGELQQNDSDGVLCGHSGLPFTRVVEGKLWHNAGVVGFPANDGTPRVWFSTLTPAGRQIVIDHHALDYDHVRAARKMRERGLPEAYAATLKSGIWDNCEILPPVETARQGQPLSEHTQAWSGVQNIATAAAE